MKKALVTSLALMLISFNTEARNLGTDYSMFKYWLNKNYGFDYSFDVSFMPQRGTPSGQYTAFQTYLYPNFTWTHFDNEYGKGSLNFAYTAIYYGNHNANDIEKRMRSATDINDYNEKATEFNEFYYSYTLGGNFNWLTLNLGQYPIYMFDGSDYNANQQVNFVNYALSQNPSSSYSSGSLGGFIEIAPTDKWHFAFGAQDAENVNSTAIRINGLSEKHFTTFGYGSWNPTNKLGDAFLSVLLYHQPSVKEQPETSKGWSVNISQNIGENFNIFGRINANSGHFETIRQSFSGGLVWLDPMKRNPLDQIGVAYAYNKIDSKALDNDLAHKHEHIIETYWAFGFSKWMTLTPDVQFYIHPALNQKSDYGTALSLRLTLFL